MEPAAIAFPNQLGEADLSRLLHLYNEVEQAAMVVAVTGDEIGSTAQQVVTVRGATDEVIQLAAAVAAAHHDGFTPRLTYGVEELLHQGVQQLIGALSGPVVDTLALRRSASAQFLYTKV